MKHGLQLEVRSGKRLGLGVDFIRYPKTYNIVAKLGTVHARLIVWPNGNAVDWLIGCAVSIVSLALTVSSFYLVHAIENLSL